MNWWICSRGIPTSGSTGGYAERRANHDSSQRRLAEMPLIWMRFIKLAPNHVQPHTVPEPFLRRSVEELWDQVAGDWKAMRGGLGVVVGEIATKPSRNPNHHPASAFDNAGEPSAA
jgi:hypothetical protein